MEQVVYVSVASRPFTSAALRELLQRARTHNTSAQLSGMLLHVAGHFFQVLEGPPRAIDALLTRITADKRHGNVLVLLRRKIDSRNFPDWSMGFADATGSASEVRGFRAKTGFADLLGDSSAVLKIIADFQKGRWGQAELPSRTS